ncbi:Putative SWI/SNF-related matrix-associated actin-dependent regulator of chromatin subfamily A member 3-like 2 [Apostasia shenzhenica]|uniref:SWI/SNF-related matrix-associated actin-dependent regulator of chromatin subfamily A member 3-like 2 n=1 Tax=Apostasia shenzhenica TaxID=1088818 RepID=A0A2H9ZTT4_9ASPA|nr:Putative SWI/SNF-related matrix-associated actin-dependent regulator of chromatin subfamily A member 3-like 2 [Apostasia shenzhenica]
MARHRGRNRSNRRKRRRGREVDISDHEYHPSHDSDVDHQSDDREDESALAPRNVLQPFPTHPEGLPSVEQRSTEERQKKSSRPDRPPLEWEIWEEENEKWVAAQEAEGSGGSDETPLLAEVMDPSTDVILPLLRFQKEWLTWALKQEGSDVRGGILADEMGMGKTIQAISLVLTARSLGSRSVDHSLSKEKDLMPRMKGTLVICPVVAVIQWVGEIKRHTAAESVRVLVFHGPKRSTAVHNFDDYDFVITTYSTIENEYRKYMMPPKQRCRFCGKMFYPAKIRIHMKYFCGEDAERTEKQAKQCRKKKQQMKTVNQKKVDFSCPGDEEGVKKSNKKTSRAYTYWEETTNTMTAKPSGKSVLHSVIWERIILDEAHYIKDRRCNTARAVFALHSLYKWALSGTPLQNRVGELYSLVRFVQIFPYAFYLCKDCDCKILDYSTSKDCPNCPHSTVRHFCWWNRYISKPIKDSAFNKQRAKDAMTLLKGKVLKSIILRRTKHGRASDLALPPRFITLRRDSLDKNEGEFYEALYTQSCLQFGTYAEAGTLMNNYAHIFDLLTRLRQAVDHPYLVVYSNTVEISGGGSGSNKSDCGICHDPAEDVVVTNCAHVFCKGCLIDYTAASGNVLCPSCARPLTVDLTTNCDSGGKNSSSPIKGSKHSRILGRIDKDSFHTSTKIDALKEEIRNMIECDASAKGIVFSQFTSFLDLISFSLQECGIKCVQLIGSMSLAEREKAINTFIGDANCKIFLMSLKAGGVALNLTVASYVFLMDPWWNPAVERQAQDRIHRIGQYKPIRTVRFIIENTVEERILRLQEKKELVFEGTVGNSSEAMAKLTEADLRFLFNI